uniref:ZP domain-containing protein n=1 Tax=Timema shepardi TaxID=629360 RepID=A0A7R9G2C9_TIMSH|nr:unnamed protein product [Timema shepardi]
MKTVGFLLLVLGAVVSLKTTAPQAALFVNTDEMGQEEQLRRSRQVDQTVKTILEWLQGRYTRRATEGNILVCKIKSNESLSSSLLRMTTSLCFQMFGTLPGTRHSFVSGGIFLAISSTVCRSTSTLTPPGPGVWFPFTTLDSVTDSVLLSSLYSPVINRLLSVCSSHSYFMSSSGSNTFMSSSAKSSQQVVIVLFGFHNITEEVWSAIQRLQLHNLPDNIYLSPALRQSDLGHSNQTPPPTSHHPPPPDQATPTSPLLNQPSTSRPHLNLPDLPILNQMFLHPLLQATPTSHLLSQSSNEPSSSQPSRPSYPQPSRPSYPQPDVPTPSPPGYPYQPSPQPIFNEPSSPQPSRPSYPQPDVPTPSPPGYPYQPSPQPSFPDLPSSSQPPQSSYPQPSLPSSLQPPGYERPNKPSPAFSTDSASESDSAVTLAGERVLSDSVSELVDEICTAVARTNFQGGGEESEGHPPHIHEIDVQCAKDQMTINLEFNTPFDGVIYSKGFYSQPACRYVQPGSGQSKYSFTVRLDSCGTQFIERFKEEGQAYLENVLVLQNEPGIQEVWDTVRRVRCLWEGSLNKALSVALSVGMLREEAVTFSGDTALARLDIQQRLTGNQLGESIRGVGESIRGVGESIRGVGESIRGVGESIGGVGESIRGVGESIRGVGESIRGVEMGRGPFAPAANGLVKIGETMTLVVSVEGDPGFDIQVRDCVARDSTSTNLVQLTDERGCVIKKKLFGAFQKTRETGSAQTSIIAYAFFQQLVKRRSSPGISGFGKPFSDGASNPSWMCPLRVATHNTCVAGNLGTNDFMPAINPVINGQLGNPGQTSIGGSS